MKLFSFILAFFAIGFFVGRAQWSRTNEIPSGEEAFIGAVTLADGAIAEKSTAIDLFTHPPQNAKYTRSEMFSLLEEAEQTQNAELYSTVLQEWARHETEEGIRAVFEIGNRHHAWQLLGTWAQYNSVRAAQIAFSIPSFTRDEARQFSEVISTSLSLLLVSDPKAAIDVERQYSPRKNTTLYIARLPIDKGDTKAQREVLETIPHFRNSWIATRIADTIFQMGNLDPEYSIDWINKHLRTDRRSSAFHAVLSNWMRSDRNAAAEFVSSQLDGTRESRALLQSFIGQSARTNPEFLTEWLKKQSDNDIRSASPMNWGYLSPQQRSSLEEALGGEFDWLAPKHTDDHLAPYNSPNGWPPETKEEVDGWLQQRNHAPGVGPENWSIETINETLALKSGELSQSSPADTRRIADKWASHDPVAAIEWAAQLPDHLMIETAETALATWFKNEPTAALDYVDEMPEGEFRSYAVERVSKDWLSDDAEAAVKWINDLPGGFSKDIARREAADRFIGHNPKRSFFQSNWIGNDVIREEVLERVFRRWTAKDPTESLEYIKQANLNEELKTTLRNHAEKNIEHRRSRDSK